MGMLLGTITTLTALFFAPTVVSWDGSTCTASTCNITATAVAPDGQVYQSTLVGKVLPANPVSFTFSDLPAHQTPYRVTAVSSCSPAQVNDVSTPEYVMGLGSPVVTPTPTPTPTVTPIPVQNITITSPISGATVGRSIPVTVVVTGVTEPFRVSLQDAGSVQLAVGIVLAGSTTVTIAVPATVVDGNYWLAARLTANGSPLGALVPVKLVSVVPTPTPTPTVDLTPIIQQAAANQDQTVTLLGQIQLTANQIKSLLQPIVVTPPTCEVTIVSVLADYAAGDYKYQVRYPKACGPKLAPSTTVLWVK